VLQLAIRVHALGAFPLSIRRRARPCGAIPCRVDVSRPQSFLLTPVLCLSVSAFKTAPATACPFAVVRVYVRPCAPMRLNSRPCGSMRAHASFSGTPVVRPVVF